MVWFRSMVSLSGSIHFFAIWFGMVQFRFQMFLNNLDRYSQKHLDIFMFMCEQSYYKCHLMHRTSPRKSMEQSLYSKH